MLLMPTKLLSMFARAESAVAHEFWNQEWHTQSGLVKHYMGDAQESESSNTDSETRQN